MSDSMTIESNLTADEVAAKCGLAVYLLRYWEMHFPELGAPTGGCKEMYSPDDVALVWRIKELLYVKFMTIDQAKKQLESERK